MDRRELERLIRKHDRLYYEKNAPIISDFEYDQLKAQLAGMEDAGFIRPAKGFKKVHHALPMLSLANAFTMDDLEDFKSKIHSFLSVSEDTNFEFVAEPKIDGLSFSAVYEEGSLVSGATRGDGSVGEDITANLRAISHFPQTISEKSRLEVRGEVYMTKQNFFALNEAQKAKGEEPFANPRNAASGSLRQLNPEVTRSRNLNYYVYAAFSDSYSTHLESLQDMQKLGFHIFNDIEICNSISQMKRYHEKYDELRSSLDFDIDGVVFKINNFAIQKQLGVVGRTPRWAIAYKFSGIKAHTKLISITLQVGRTGVVTPVAELEPVNIGGVEVARATLHNEDNIKSKDLRVGDTVLIERAGDVIPQVLESIQHADNSSEFVMPKECPACGSALVKLEDEAQYRCLNDSGCLPQRIEKLRHFVSKEAFNIEGLGIKQIEMLFEKGLVVNYADIFTLQSRDGTKYPPIRKWKGFGERSAFKLFGSINGARSVTLHKLIYAIGIRHVGDKTAQMIAKHITKPTDLLDANITQQLAELDGIGEATIDAIHEYFSKSENVEHFKDLLAEVSIAEEIVTSGKLSAENIVFTGTLSTMSRAAAKDIAERLGATVSSSITNSVTMVVAGEDAGSKLKEAAKRAIKILKEEEWLELIK